MGDTKYPVWAESGERTKPLIQWLLQGDDCMLELGGYSLAKARKDGCCLLYAAGIRDGYPGGNGGMLAFCGIFNPRNFFLYDVRNELRAAAGIPGDFCFPKKQDIRLEAEKRISQYGGKRIREEWEAILAGAPYSVRELIPVIDRTDIRKTAEKLYQEGKTAVDVVYRPQFLFGRQTGDFTDEVYLLYLNHQESVVRAFAGQWLKKELPKISQERIRAGCIKNELQEILQKNHKM